MVLRPTLRGDGLCAVGPAIENEMKAVHPSAWASRGTGLPTAELYRSMARVSRSLISAASWGSCGPSSKGTSFARLLLVMLKPGVGFAGRSGGGSYNTNTCSFTFYLIELAGGQNEDMYN